MNGLPTVPVHDLEIHPRDGELIAATHGRAIWIIDIAPLQQLGRVRLADEPAVFDPVPGLQFGDAPSGGESTGHRYFEGETRPFGAEIVYWIPEGWRPPQAEGVDREGRPDRPAAGERTPEERRAAMRARMAQGGPPGRGGPGGSRGPQAEITVISASGDTVATLQGPLRPGLQRVRWNMRPRAAGEEEPKSPAELRDSVEAARILVEVADSMVENGELERATTDRALAMARSGNLAGMFGGGGGGTAAGDPARPGERYPEAAPGWAEEAAAAEEQAEEEAAEPSMDEIRDAMRSLFRAMRSRGASMSFRGGFGRGFGGGAPVEPGDYTVSVKIGERTHTTTLTVVRAANYTPDVEEDDAWLEAWLDGEVRD
jgi:hypothetical protein